MNEENTRYDIYQPQNESDSLLNFLNEVDALFPIPLSQKCNLSDYCHKILDNGIFIVASFQNRIVGLLGGYVNDFVTQSAYISLVAVLPEFQNQSIAKKLICTFIETCREKKMKRIFLNTHIKNYTAQHMYEKLGFAPAKSKRPDDILYEYFL